MQNQLIAQQRISQLRLANPNIAQQTGGQPRIVLQQQSQQVRMITPGAQQQPQVAPPPPYPGPPPPYPGNNVTQSTDSQVRQPFALCSIFRMMSVTVRFCELIGVFVVTLWFCKCFCKRKRSLSR